MSDSSGVYDFAAIAEGIKRLKITPLDCWLEDCRCVSYDQCIFDRCETCGCPVDRHGATLLAATGHDQHGKLVVLSQSCSTCHRGEGST